MEWFAEITSPNRIRCIIAQDELKDSTNNKAEAAYYLYVYEGDNDFDTWDYCMGSLEAAKGQAYEQFGIPLDAWIQK